VSEAGELRAEVLVLGAGPGGYTAAFRAADLGLRVVLVERDATLGGVCLNVGCIPSKALLHLAEVVVEARAVAAHGVEFGAPRFDLARIRAFKDGVVKRLTTGLAGLAKRRGVEVVRGSGTFTGPDALSVDGPGGPRRIAFEHAIVAAGSRPVRLPGLPDDPRVLDSTGALELAAVPERLLVVGGGIIGLEMAAVYHALGSRITVVELLEELVAGADRDVVRPLHKTIESRYEQILLGTKLASVEARPDGLHVALEGRGGGARERFDAVLVAVGRRPNADAIGCDAAGLEIDDAGFVRVDAERRTSVPHIFAIGDVAGPPMLAHKAMHEGKVAAEVIAGLPARFDAASIPSVAYTDPEVAWTGLTEAQAESQGIAVRKAVFPWSASGRALGIDRSEGLTKLLLDPESGRILGAGIVGRNAGELVAELGLAIEMGADAEDVALTIHPHPTLSETVGLAAEVATGTATDLYLKRG
jgi:dihydrolipoamide dehydrogenase